MTAPKAQIKTPLELSTFVQAHFSDPQDMYPKEVLDRWAVGAGWVRVDNVT